LPRTRRRAAAPPAETRSSRSSDSSDESSAADPRPADAAASRAGDDDAPPAADDAASRRPTWRDLSFNQSDVPVDESVRLAANVAEVKDPPVVTPTASTSGARHTLFQRLGGSKPAVATAEASQSLCRIDPTDRRVVDLRLPALDGKIVSFNDIDADLILLDFWGSWCKECRKSIPHLSELQAKYGENRLRVIGVACERGASLQERQASATKAARGLKINYSVLVSSMDGSCPVQKGMQIQFYPTMVLLSRDGRIIQREQGATDATLARIDRAIATTLK
jgi:thiol-disulfide isomerase/thioredoxin